MITYENALIFIFMGVTFLSYPTYIIEQIILSIVL